MNNFDGDFENISNSNKNNVTYGTNISYSRNVDEAGIKKMQELFKNVEYFREIPCNKDLFIIADIAKKTGIVNYETNLIGALILSWIKDKKVEFNHTKTIFGKRKTIIKFIDNIELSDEMEKTMYHEIKSISKNNLLESNELNKWFERNRFMYYNLFSKIETHTRNKMIKYGFCEEILEIPNGNNDINNNLENVQNIIESKIKEDYKKLGIKVEVRPLAKQIESSTFFRYNNLFIEEAKKIAGLKKFIVDFSILSEKEAMDVHIWEDYLIIAVLLNVANNVIKQFEELYPNIEYKDFISFSSSFGENI